MHGYSEIEPVLHEDNIAYFPPYNILKNMTKRRINPGKVTHVTCVTKQTTRGPRSKLVRAKPQSSPITEGESVHSSPTKTAASLQSSPIKPSGSISQLSQPISNPVYSDWDNINIAFEDEDIRPLRFSLKKVLSSSSYTNNRV